MYQCDFCNYESIHNHNVTRHKKRRHANKTKHEFDLKQ